MTNEVPSEKTLGGIVFRINFLRTMLPVMSPADVDIFYDCAESFRKMTMKADKMIALDTLFKKFSEEINVPNRTLPPAG